VFQLNEEPLTGQSGPVNLAGKMSPKKKTPERGARKERKTSSRKKEKATVIRDEPEQNLFLECLQSINQPPTATEPSEKRRSARLSHSTSSRSTPSPSTRAASPKGKEVCQRIQQSTRVPSPKGKEECQHNQQSSGENSPRKKERFKIHTSLNKEGLNVNFQEWLGELAAGHTSHTNYMEWLTERIDDNRQLTREAVAAEEQIRDKRLLLRLAGWGNGLNRPTAVRVVMRKDRQVIVPERSEGEAAPAPAHGEEQQDPMISIEGPLLSGLVPPNSTLLPGTVTKFSQDFKEEGEESDRSNESLGTNAGVDPIHGSSGSDADNDVDYNGTSSEEERRSPENQSVSGKSTIRCTARDNRSDQSTSPEQSTTLCTRSK
jgi:hypothetical protein